MYAIVEIAGQQFKVEEGLEIFVHQLQADEGDQLSFDRVLLVDKDGDITVGTPTVPATAVSATVLGHVKGDKVIVYKKKRRKGYEKKNGHRQKFTKIKIEAIGAQPAARAAMSTAAPTAGDDLTKIEGIGPKIAELFNRAGIHTFAELATKSPEELMEILRAGGSQFASKNPDTWARQAQLAADGNWTELKAWQDELDGGIER